MQALSRPILVLSIATVFSDQSECSSGTSDGVGDSHTYSEQHLEQSSEQSNDSNLDTRYIIEQDGAYKFEILSIKKTKR